MADSGCNRDAAYQKTQKQGPAEYARQLKKLCSNLGSEEKHIVFMDKNHPENAVDRLISEINSYLPFNVNA